MTLTADPPRDADEEQADFDAWELTAKISPRRVVRAAAVGPDGQPLNFYPLLHPVEGNRPLTPWAVHLADREGRFHLLCADLDARVSAEAAARDAELFAGLLVELGVPHVTCESGPTGGRHVWLGLVEGIDSVLVASLAHLLKSWLPSMDVAPLLNPASGCVRPPGAPHRLGGTSRVLSGAVGALTTPSVTRDHLNRLIARLADRTLASYREAVSHPRPIASVAGPPYLPGTRRALSASCRALLDAVPTGDLSAVLWRILCGAAVAHWRFADVIGLADSPGLEHARTMRSGTTRVPRPTTGPASPTSVLRRQWARAVAAMATMPSERQAAGDDPTFDRRAEVTTAVVRTVQQRADASPRRWATRSGLAQRRVLDALCLYQLQAVRADDVEADIRRLALTSGIDRETARRSLIALAADGWVTRTHPSSGPRGARWTTDPGGVIHTRVLQMLSQADPRPAGTGPALRLGLLAELEDRLKSSSHDAFAPSGGLGLAAGSLYGRLGDPKDTVASGLMTGWTPDKTAQVLGQLVIAGLVVGGEGGWRRTSSENLDSVAVELGTQGLGEQRADRYAFDRAAWGWWQAELAWMRSQHLRRGAHPARPTLRAIHNGGSADGRWPAHPRRRGGRADFSAARRALVLGSAAQLPSMLANVA